MLKRLFGSIEKTETQDDGSLIVEGIVSSEAIDSDGEVVTSDAMKAALPDYMKFGNIREMHQPSAAGVALHCDVENGVTKIVGKIVDSEAVKKVVSGVYKGFSIGAKVLKRSNLNKSIIEGIRLVEISLVDRPANPDALLTCWKGDAMDKDELKAEGAEEVKAEGQPEVKTDEAPAQEEKPADEAPVEEKAPEAAQDESAPTEQKDPEPQTVESEKSEQPEIEKGLYGTASLAEVVSALKNICLDAKFEADMEGDNSPVPAMLQGAFKQLVEAFKAMASEEADEAASELGGDEVEMMAKVSALVDEKLKKALQVKDDEIKKLAEKITTLETENTELKDKAAPPKGAVKAVSKENDATKLNDEDSTPVEVTAFDLMKAVHAQGGARINL